MKNLKVMAGLSLLMLMTILACHKDQLSDPLIDNRGAKVDSAKTLSISTDTTKQILTVSTDSLNIDTKSRSITVDYLKTFSAKAGDSDYFILKSNTSWKIVRYPSWVSVKPLSGNGNMNVTVTVMANTGLQRTGSIAISGTNVSRTTTISAIQLAGSTTNPGSLSVDYLKTFSSIAGDYDTFNITTNTSWKIESYPSWMEINPLSGTGNAVVKVTVQANTGTQRTGTITISGNGVSVLSSINAIQVATIATVEAPLATSQKADYFVAVTGNDNNPGTNDKPFASIKHAYSVAVPGNLILVKAGTYTETGTYGLEIAKTATAEKPITIKSEVKWGAKLDLKNINDGQHNRIMTLGGSYNIIDGFEMTGGFIEGISLYNAINCSVINCNINHNGNIGIASSTDGQDGIFSSSNSTGNQYLRNYIHHNGRTATHNQLDHGLYLTGDNELVAYNIITHNTAWGIQIIGATNSRIYNNVCAWNGESGVLLWRDLVNLEVKNNILYSNTKYGIHSTVGDFGDVGSNIIIENNIYYKNNLGDNLLNVPSKIIIGSNKLNIDPLFVDSKNDDFHILLGSPAINYGFNWSQSQDFDGFSKNGTNWDIGAFEFK